MPRRRYVEIEVEGVDELLARIRAHGPERRLILRQWLEHLGEHATAYQRMHAPRGDTGYLHAHIGMTGVQYLPGGAFGGGTYQVVSGIRRGVSDHPFYVHFGTKNIITSGGGSDFLFRAAVSGFTGDRQGRIYPRADRAPATSIATTLQEIDDRTGRPIYRRISDRRRLRAGGEAGVDAPSGLRQPALTFQKRGEPRKFRRWVSGQRPQPFVYLSYINTAIYAKGQLRAIARHVL